MGQATSASPESRKPKLQLEPHQIILRPLVTEKGMHRATRNNAVCVRGEPAGRARTTSAQAVEDVVQREGGEGAHAEPQGQAAADRFKQGRTKNWKKAIVTLDSEHRIDFF